MHPAVNLYSYRGVRPTLGANVFIAPNATVLGDVWLGDEASVWFGVVLRGDVHAIRIGARTNVQDNAVVHVTGGKATTTIGDDVTIGHLALLHGCTVGNQCLIGMGSVILDHAVVEDECIVAAGSLLPPGMRVPRGSLVKGRPAAVVRTLTEADLAFIRSSSANYIKHARSFADDITAIEE